VTAAALLLRAGMTDAYRCASPVSRASKVRSFSALATLATIATAFDYVMALSEDLEHVFAKSRPRWRRDRLGSPNPPPLAVESVRI
jgi:hypothetical protein